MTCGVTQYGEFGASIKAPWPSRKWTENQHQTMAHRHWNNLGSEAQRDPSHNTRSPCSRRTHGLAFGSKDCFKKGSRRRLRCTAYALVLCRTTPIFLRPHRRALTSLFDFMILHGCELFCSHVSGALGPQSSSLETWAPSNFKGSLFQMAQHQSSNLRSKSARLPLIRVRSGTTGQLVHWKLAR